MEKPVPPLDPHAVLSLLSASLNVAQVCSDFIGDLWGLGGVDKQVCRDMVNIGSKVGALRAAVLDVVAAWQTARDWEKPRGTSASRD